MATTKEKELHGALERLNNNLQPSGRFVDIQSRNGYIGLDAYVIATGKCIDCIASANNNAQMLNLLYAMSRGIELLSNPI